MKKVRTEKSLERDEKIPEDSAIFLEHLSFGYDEKKPILKDVHCDIKKGQVVSVIGHNGAGKSTLARLVDGILEQTGGEIYLFGVRMTDANALRLRQDVGLVFQNPDSQFIGATVRDDIAFGLENACVPSNEMEAIVERCAKQVGMFDYLDTEPSMLSGGQKQRVAIAGMMARHPKILILDEAGAMLDPKGKREIRAIIEERKREEPSLTILNITHEIDEAYRSDRVLVLNDGGIAMDGMPNEVFSKDEALWSMHLDIPFLHKLRKDLKEKGLDVGPVNSEEELIQKLCPSASSR